MSSKHILTLAVAAVLVAPLAAEERIDHDMNWKLRRLAREQSEVMTTLHMLTDVHGPRLTGSPAYEAAARWAAEQLTAWGLKNARLEPWEFGHPGWSNERASMFLVSPVADTLTGEVTYTPTAGYFGADAPFGGYKQSGVGREMGLEGLMEYMEVKTIGFPAT